MAKTKNLWKVVIMMKYKHEKFSLQLWFVYLYEKTIQKLNLYISEGKFCNILKSVTWR